MSGARVYQGVKVVANTSRSFATNVASRVASIHHNNRPENPDALSDKPLSHLYVLSNRSYPLAPVSESNGESLPPGAAAHKLSVSTEQRLQKLADENVSNRNFHTRVKAAVQTNGGQEAPVGRLDALKVANANKAPAYQIRDYVAKIIANGPGGSGSAPNL